MRWHMDLASLGAAAHPDKATQSQLSARLHALSKEPLITWLNETADLEAAEPCVKHFRKRSDITWVIGTGGASLGAQALLGVAQAEAVRMGKTPHAVAFVDNIDPATLAQAFVGYDLTRMSWVFISKSGETVETLATILSIVGMYAQAGLLPELAQRTAVITTAQESSLREMAIHYGWRLFDHPEVGGRYSVFTLVGMLPAMLMGLNARALRQGATQWMVHAMSAAEHPVFASAWWLAHSRTTSPIHVVMPYADSLRAYTRWFQQLWAESLGKSGNGSTPFAALGAIDQHSQLQLFLDGPKDKSFTFVLPARSAEGTKIAANVSERLAFLHGRTMGQVMDASAEATVATLRRHAVPLRVLRTTQLDAFSMGELMLMHMVETVLVAELMGVNPYDQPAVEEGKILTRQFLQIMEPLA